MRVAGADPDVFGIGGYSLVTQFDAINLVSPAEIDAVANGAYRFLSQNELAKFFDADENELFNDDGHSDDEASLGVELNSLPGFVADSRYETTGSIADATDVDYYSIKSPDVAGLSVMTVAVRSLDVAGLIPSLTILDENQNPLPTEIVVNGGGELVVQVTGIDPHKDYLIGVQAADPGGPFDSGNYRLGVAFTNAPVALAAMATGTVGDAVTGNTHTLYIGRPQLFHLVLEAGNSTTAVPSAIIATIKDENSTVVATIASPPGERRSLPGVFLNAGTYTVEVVVRTLDGSLSSAVSYSLLGTSISDPFVGDPEDPNSHPFACMDPELAGFFCYPGRFHFARSVLVGHLCLISIESAAAARTWTARRFPVGRLVVLGLERNGRERPSPRPGRWFRNTGRLRWWWRRRNCPAGADLERPGKRLRAGR